MFKIDKVGVRHIGDYESKIDELKAKLIEYDWTKDISLACDICKWLHKELIKQPKIAALKVGLIGYSKSKDTALASEICEWLYKELIKQPKKIEVKEG